MPHLHIGPLVRATSTRTVVIWAELSEACDVELQLVPFASPENADPSALSIRTSTVQVGGHYYIAPQVQGLQPSTWYTYALSLTSGGAALMPKSNFASRQCFRTFALPGTVTDTTDERRELRLAYGSCRKGEQDATDALNALGTWLQQQYAQRDETWPHLLLFIGDQIYADEPPAEVVRNHPHLQQGAQTFEDFSILYEHAWAHDPGTQQALAAVPSFMIFDDHEVRNNWDVEPTWRDKVIREGGEQLLVDALVAYWVYQGWGNLVQDTVDHPLLTIMREAAQSGVDALEQLRTCIKADVYKQVPIRWHYVIPTQPAIFVANARTERTTVFDAGAAEVYGPTRIMSHEQMQDIQHWLQSQEQYPPIFVSSVPILLPPLIGVLQYLAGLRPWATPGHPLRWLGRQLARLQLFVADKASFDHWPLYAATWHEFIQSVLEKQQQLVILGGDVHFSYSLIAHPPGYKGGARLYQFVSTPLQNVLGQSSERKVRLQAFITSMAYGGLQQRILPLKATGTRARIYKELLFENALAFVSLRPTTHNSYQIRQEYLSCVDDELRIVGFTELPVKA
ncbi:MAG: alkaline phosphatase D family protein [Ktedonobacteraceae bacterium]